MGGKVAGVTEGNRANLRRVGVIYDQNIQLMSISAQWEAAYGLSGMTVTAPPPN